MSIDETDVASSLTNRKVFLGVLMMIYVCSYLDRQIIAILLPQIKAEFDVPDLYLGMLSGLAFAVFYTTLGLPLARIAEKKSRVNLLTICIAVWSIMTMVCGAAVTFVQLMLARIGVGVGEAGCNPSAHSLISDYFPFERRASALAVYALGVPLGMLLGLSLGGWLGDKYGWRITMLAVGLPGLVLAILAKILIKEPPRGHSEAKTMNVAAQAAESPSAKETFTFLWRTRTFRALCVSAAADAFVGYGLLIWLPTYLIRNFELSGSEVGLHLGLLVGISGVIGALGAGYLADKFGARDKRFYCWIPAIAACIALVANLGVYTSSSINSIYLLLIIPMITLPASGAPVYAAVQSIAPLRMRATASAVLLLVVNLVGLGFGPTFIGAMSDFLAPIYGADSLRLAMRSIVIVYIISAIAAFIASRHFVADLERVGKSSTHGS